LLKLDCRIFYAAMFYFNQKILSLEALYSFVSLLVINTHAGVKKPQKGAETRVAKYKRVEQMRFVVCQQISSDFLLPTLSSTTSIKTVT
jgi:hypothetical protein